MKIKLFGVLLFLVTFVSCELGTKLTKDTKETVVTGTTTILVDETIFPIVEDVVAVFENEYKNAKINLIAKPEGEIIRLLKDDKSKIAIMARDLSRSEVEYYAKKNIIPKVTAFGEDAVVFIAHQFNPLESVSVEELSLKLKGTETKQLNYEVVFGNPESSTLSFLKSKLGMEKIAAKSAYSLKDSKELIRFIAANKNAVGIIGVNLLLQPSQDIEKEVQDVKILGINTKGIMDGKPWVKPNQSNIADHSYPWTRKLYLLNFQGANGLGMGFASYIAGENGQRIILKSGLSPIKFPSREINIKGSIE